MCEKDVIFALKIVNHSFSGVQRMKKVTRNTGLVLQGGGMRGVFTSGVLDAFMKHELWFRYIVAVSAGACNGLSYMSRQPRRARISNIDLLAKHDYIGLKHLVTKGSIFDPELLYDRFTNEMLPFDYDTCFANPATFEMVTTNCLTGRAEYLEERKDRERLIRICQASASMPYVSQIVRVDGIPMLDGGIVDGIPVMRAIQQGHEENVVVLTRNYGYRDSMADRKLPRLIYNNYPRLRVALSRMNRVYNQQMDLVEKLEREGRVVCIRPERPMEVGRMEKNVGRLERLYQEGFALGEKFVEQYVKD